jgi:general stress protein 26
MVRVRDSEKERFLREVDVAARRAVWCALATVAEGEPRVRLVHPTWEKDILWLATDPGSPKARQLRADPRVEVQYQVAPPDFVHIRVRGTAEVVDDPQTRERVWNLLDYDLSDFWPRGPSDPSYVPVRIVPDRVELSEMFGTRNVRIWRRA